MLSVGQQRKLKAPSVRLYRSPHLFLCLSLPSSICLSLLSSSLKQVCGLGNRIRNTRSCTSLDGYINLPPTHKHRHTHAHKQALKPLSGPMPAHASKCLSPAYGYIITIEAYFLPLVALKQHVFSDFRFSLLLKNAKT